MKCSVCGNRDAGCATKKKGAKLFFVRMQTSFKKYSNVPCHARKLFKTSKYLPARAPDGDEYMLKLKKGVQKTRICGADYEMILEEYDLCHNDKIRFEILQNDGYLSMTPLDNEGSIMEKVVWVHADEVEGHLIGAEARALVVSGGILKLHPQQMDRINECIAEHGTGLGGIWVHRMTSSDINHNGLRIPKHIASVLPISRSGTANLDMGELDGVNIADYYTSTDGRIRFRAGWTEFAAANKVEVGDILLIMFYMIDSVLQISFDFV